MEILKPNPDNCKGCKYFIAKGTVIADRFPVKVDDCFLITKGGECECVTKKPLSNDDNGEVKNSEL